MGSGKTPNFGPQFCLKTQRLIWDQQNLVDLLKHHRNAENLAEFQGFATTLAMAATNGHMVRGSWLTGRQRP